MIAWLCMGTVAACDFGPSGPGTLVARVSADAVGAVVLEVEGRGIQGFSGRGSTQVYSAPLPERPNVHRVILMDSEGGELGFEVRVDDRGMDGPFISVVQAAGADNSMLPSGSVTVRMER
jgi:hypothetical protein